MQVLFICGVYSNENTAEVLENSKSFADQAANVFQKKLIKGIKQNGYRYKIISAPFIGAYPMGYKQIRFNGFSALDPEYRHVPFNNIWGIRNISRAFAVKKAIREYFDRETEDEYLILVYSAHTPFLKAAEYAKKLKPDSKICLIVPDLPQYMNQSSGHRALYDFFKKYDIMIMNRYIETVDSFVILTEAMKESLGVGDRPYTVVEGIIDKLPDAAAHVQRESHKKTKQIVYTGNMSLKYGIKELVDVFMQIQDESCRLILCGEGDARKYVEQMAERDPRIEYKGQVSAQEAKEYIKHADVLVNPRPNNGEYTKYSFPSKTIEYLLSGNPVVANMLDGMPECYKRFLVVPDEGLKPAIQNVLSGQYKKDPVAFFEYAGRQLSAERIVKNIHDMTFS